MNWPGDVAVIPVVAEPECSLEENDAAVCAVLRWAKRTTGADVADAGHVCAVLGLDLSGAVERARNVGLSVTDGHDAGRYPTDRRKK